MKNCKQGEPLGFLKIHFVANYKKKLRGPSGDNKKIAKKISQSQINMHKKFLVKGETRTFVLLLPRPQKILINLYAK